MKAHPFILGLALALFWPGMAAAEPYYRATFIFPQEQMRDHASCVVECPNGDLLACWYHGAGETAYDKIIEGARLERGAAAWSKRFLLADTPDFPDDNPCMIVDSARQLWLLWPTRLTDKWQSAIMRYKISGSYEQQGDGAPQWGGERLLLIKPENFKQQLEAGLAQFAKDHPEIAERFPEQAAQQRQKMLEAASDELTQRIGWMTRAHPLLLPSGRLIVPLYTDAYSATIMAITDDGGLPAGGGQAWRTSSLLAGVGNIQAALVRKNDGRLVAYMRDAGPLKRIRVSESQDDGLTWGPVGAIELPNPGTAVDVARLANGHWALVYNDTVKGRETLAVSISDDEGKSWRWTRHLERSAPGLGTFSYPSIIQARDGLLHVTYTFIDSKGSSIKHAAFNEEWVQQGG